MQAWHARERLLIDIVDHSGGLWEGSGEGVIIVKTSFCLFVPVSTSLALVF